MRKKWPSHSNIQRDILKSLPANVRVLLLDDRANAVSKIPTLARAAPGQKVLDVAAHSPNHWVHDYLPEMVINPEGRPELVHFAYASPEDYEQDSKDRFRYLLTGQGEKPPPQFPLNGLVARSLADFLSLPLRRSEIVLHGGHYIAGEGGTIFLSKALLRKNESSRRDLEDQLKTLLFAKEIVWLPDIFSEPTGHLDVYAMYLGQKRFLLQRTSDDSFWNREVDKAAETLSALGYRVDWIISPSEKRFYVNSRRFGQTLFMPVYANRSFFGKIRMDEHDVQAKAKFESLGFAVVPVPATELDDKMGGLHCLTKSYRCNF